MTPPAQEEDAVPAEGLVARVRALAPLIASASFEAEQQRRPLDEVIDALKATGVFRAFVPARYGGYEIDLATYVDVGLSVAQADPSMGWVTTFYMEHNWLLTMFAEELQDEVFGAQSFVLAPGTVNPSGRAARSDDGGFTLSGHWQFATGICHADWVLLNATIEDGDTVGTRLFLVPLDEVEVKDTWYVDGMAATGSRDVVATDVRVPERRGSLAVPPHVLARPGAPYLERIPLLPFLSLTAAIPAVGAATRALELFEALVFERIQFGTKRVQSAWVPTQMRLANLRVEVDFAETLLRDIAARMQAHTDGVTDLDLLAQQQLRLAVAHVVRRCRDVIREILASSGASAHYLDHELQRLHRDIHMICAHTVFDVDLVAEGVGRAIVAAHDAATGVRLMDVPELARRYVAALSTPDEATLADLEPALAADVHGAGVFGWGDRRDEVLATMATPPFPIMGMATWADPIVDGDRVTIRADFPPGLPVVGATVTLRIAGGLITEAIQELETAPPPEPTALALDDTIASLIDGALDNRTAVVVAYVDADGVPHQSPRGTVQVWSPDQLALWIRDPNGGLLRAIATNPQLSCFYRDAKTRAAYELTGRARRLEDPDDRRRVFAESPRVEQNLDPMLRGVAVVVDLDVVAGGGPGGRVNMRSGRST